MPDAGRCSVASALRAEPMAGTAPEARRWVLIEHPGPWARNPIDTPPLAGVLGQRLEEALDQFGAKLLLVRPTGRGQDLRHRMWRVVDTMTGMSLSGTWRADRDLEAVLPALAGCAGPLSEPAPPLVLVCTHGVRDACCAIKGRPVAGAVARAMGEVEVLECSHLNGHRFAGTALVLPEGVCYGRLEQADAARTLARHFEGNERIDRLRGLCGLPAAAQTAHLWALEQLALQRPDAPVALSDIEVGSISPEVDGVTRVEVIGLTGDGVSAWVDVRRTDLEPASLSCGKEPVSRVGHVVLTRPLAMGA